MLRLNWRDGINSVGRDNTKLMHKCIWSHALEPILSDIG